MADYDKIDNMYNQSDIKIEQVIEHVRSNRETLENYISNGIDIGYNITLVHLTGENAFKRPVWFTSDNTESTTSTYNAQKYKDKILSLFKKKPGYYGYGILLGEQPGGFYLVCIDIDIDNECKDRALSRFEELFKGSIHYHLEITKSNRYHIYVALDKIPENLKKITKLRFDGDCVKYVNGKQVKGEIELLGVNGKHTITVYNGIINNEKPVFNDRLIINNADQFLQKLIEFQGGLDPDVIDDLAKFYKLVRDHRFINGWNIDKVVSAFCVRNQIPNTISHRIFEQIYGNEYNEKRTENILEKSKEKIDFIPNIGSIFYHIKQVLNNNNELTKEEIEFVKSFRAKLFDKYNDNGEEPELPDYLTGVENIYQIFSRKKSHHKRGTYYKEKYFVERNIDNVKEVWYIELEADVPNAIYKRHELISDPRAIGIKTVILRLLNEKSDVYEILINDEIKFIPSFSFGKLEDIAIEISNRCSRYLARFDIPLFQDYLTIKMREFRKKHGGVPEPCFISKNTGWSDDFKMFFHYDLNDEKHELSKDNPLYKYRKAESKNQKEQHEFVLKLLKEGKLLGVLLSISVSSIFLKPFNLQPLTCILAGNPGAGKTTASLIATSLFYKSDTILLNANATNVGIELTLSDLKSMPFVIDEGALADVGISLKHTIFSVASGKGRTRGRKDLSVDTKEIVSNVFWTTETTDVDEIRRGGAYRRMLYITVEEWKNFTQEVELSTKEPRPNEKFAGCGVDYIRFAVENLDKLSDLFIKETRDFSRYYGEITGLASNIYAGIVFLEQYYNQKFDQLRQTVDELLREAKKTFVLTRDNIVEMLQQYLYNNQHKLGKAKKEEDGNGGSRYIATAPTSKEMLGEYDESTQTYYISVQGFKTIAKELEKERTLLINALVKAGVMEKESIIYHSKVTKSKIRGYKLKFPDLPDKSPPYTGDNTPPSDNPPDSPITPEPMPADTPPDKPSNINTVDKSPIDEPSDSEVDFFSETPMERQQREKQAKQQAKQQLNSQHIETKPHNTQPLGISNNESEHIEQYSDETTEPIIDEICDDEIKEEPESAEQIINEEGNAGMDIKPIKQEQSGSENRESKENKSKNKIIIDENTLDIYYVKPRSEIPTYQIPKKNIKPFSELTIGSLDIETTGLEETDQILAIAFDIYENGKLIDKKRFYVDEYDNDDTKMVSAFLDKLKESNINVLTGWNIYDFDLQRTKAKDKNNKLRFTEPSVNISGAKLNNKQLQGYCIYVDNKYIEVIDAMHLVIKYDAIARDIPAQDYGLKNVAKHFGISKADRVVLGADEIREYFKTNRALFNEYFDEDVREAYEIFKKLAPPYYYVKSIVPFNISFFKAFRSSTASIWERILEHYYDSKDPDYKNNITADEKKDYEGALVIVNKGLYRNVYKIDVASLYPNIMLNYHIHSRKDTDKIALAILNEYTNLRLQLKKRAKEGDKEADLVQNSLKILINSLYGFYGTGGYLFNDMYASALITAYGRKILREMIKYVEENGGIIIECDTDGIYYSAKNGVEIYEGLRKKLNDEINFDIELEYKDCIMYASDKKNYILIEPNGKVKKKGSKYAGRDKNKLWTEFVVEYIRRYIKNPASANAYEKEIRDSIYGGKAFDWLKITRKVGKNDKTIIEDAKSKGIPLTHGSIVTYVYKNAKKGKYTFENEEPKTYDIKYYAGEFTRLMKEIKDVITSTKQY